MNSARIRRIMSVAQYGIAVTLALWLGYAGARTDDMGIVAGLLFTFAAAFTFASRGRPLLWALFWGLSHPLVGLLYLALGLDLRYVSHPGDSIPSLLALIPAFMGAYSGEGLRRFITPTGRDVYPLGNDDPHYSFTVSQYNCQFSAIYKNETAWSEALARFLHFIFLRVFLAPPPVLKGDPL